MDVFLIRVLADYNFMEWEIVAPNFDSAIKAAKNEAKKSGAKKIEVVLAKNKSKV